MSFAIILFAHWLGDYIFQSENMALNKSGSIKWLSIHVLTYSVIILAFVLFLLPLKLAFSYFLLNAAIHWAVDLITSKAASHFRDQPRIFYPILGFDQFLHTLSLYLSFIYLEQLSR